MFRPRVIIATVLVFLAGSPAAGRASPWCARVRAAIAAGKTAEQVAQEMNASARRVRACLHHPTRAQRGFDSRDCTVMERSLAAGKTVHQVAQAWHVMPRVVTGCIDLVRQERADAVADCMSHGGPNRPLMESVRGDVDGDGKADELSVELRDCQPTLVAQLTRLGRRERRFELNLRMALDDNLSPQHIRVVETHHGRGWILVETDRGASTTSLALFRLVGDTLLQMTLGGRPAIVESGGSVMDDNDFVCGAGTLVTIHTTTFPCTTESCDGCDCSVRDQDVYALQGARLVLTSRTRHNSASCSDPSTGCPEFRK